MTPLSPSHGETIYRQPTKEQSELEQLRLIYRNFVHHLAETYRDGNAVEIAGLCDEVLDRSGGLLGHVRDVARRHSERTGDSS